MAKQVVDFTQGGPLTGDSGERGNSTPGTTAIKPYTDGERAVAANFDRPPENLRQRTEVLRTETEEQKYLQDSDMKWLLGSGNADGLHAPAANWPTIITWVKHPIDSGSRWYFEVGPDPTTAVVAQPLNTPRQDFQESKTWEFPFAASGYVTIATSRRSYSGANIREIIWEALPFADIAGVNGVPSYCDLLLSGEDNHILTITVRDDDITTVANLQTGFTAYFVSLGLAGFTCSTSGDLLAKARIGDIPVAELDYIMSGTQERELHYIPAVSFVDFFDVEDPLVPGSYINCLEDGDTVSIVWEYFIEPGGGTDGRCQAIPSSGNTTVLVGQLFNTRLHPEYIPLAIPLCKRIGNELVWLDGTIITAGMTTPIRLGENGYTVQRIYSAPTTVPITMGKKFYDAPWPWPSSVPENWTTIQGALDGIVKFLAGTQDSALVAVDPELGARLIGVPEITTTNPKPSLGFYEVPALGDDLKEVIHQMLLLINVKSSLDKGATFGTDEETVTGRWRFNNHVGIGADKAFLRAAFGGSSYYLVYRNGGISETGSVGWETYSVYEKADALGKSGSRIEVWGGTLNSGGGVVTASSALGNGTVTVVCHRNQDPAAPAVTCRIAEACNVVPGTTLNLNDETVWDYYWFKYYSGGDYYSTVYGKANSYQRWEINQEIRDDINFISGAARVQVASRPWSLVLDGLYMLPEHLGYSDQPGYWTANRLKISAGRALVDGKPVIRDTTDLITDLRLLFFPSVTLPASDGALTPRWYYVWLRHDGEIRIGADSPTGDFESGSMIPGEQLYRVSAAEATSDGHTPQEYTLIDVISLMCMTGSNQYYFDCAPPIGGGERRVLRRICPLDSLPFIYMVREASGDDPSPVIDYLNVKHVTPSWRSPGIPTGVSSKASLAYKFDVTSLSAGSYASVLIGLNCGSLFAIPPGQSNGLYPFAYPLGGGGTTDCLPFFKRQFENNGIGPLSHDEFGTLDVTTNYGVGGTYWSQIQTDASPVLDLYLLGFYWDRSAGVQSLKS